MKLKRLLFLIIFITFLISTLGAQIDRQTGVIRGVITDNEGHPLPGVTLTATGPSLIGTVSDVSKADGSFRLPVLPPGTYEVKAELSGFKTVRRGAIIVRVGMTVTINIQMEVTTIEEEITVTAPSPTIDVRSTKISNPVTTELLEHLPMNRSLTSIFSALPGAAGTIATYSGSIHGASAWGVTYEIDGVNANCPTTGGFYGTAQFDSIEEIEILSGGLPSQVGATGGAFVNIVTRSGGNSFHGQIQGFYTHKKLNEILFRDEQLSAMAIGKPRFTIYDLDSSATLGGPIIKDKIWFFSTVSFAPRKWLSLFIPTTIFGKKYDQYEYAQATWQPQLKLTAQLSKSLRFFLIANGWIFNNENYEDWARKSYDANFRQKNNWRITSTANLNWLISNNTFLDLRIGTVYYDYPITSKPDYDANTCYRDIYTGYYWNGIQSWQSFMIRHTRIASARLTHFLDDFLGGNHEFGAGLEYQWGFDRYGYARTNPMNWHYYNGNPYYYRGYYNLTSPHPVFGDGRLEFTNCGTAKGDSWKDLIEYRIAGYLQDSWTIKNRFTINAGIRLDHLKGWGGEATSTGIGGLPFEIGKSLQPSLGFNPFGPFKVEPIKGVVNFVEISPRIGLSYDLFGDGKTALKLSFSRYVEGMPVMWFSSVSPPVMAQYTFNWWDLNKNGTPDAPPTDKYEPTAGLGVFAKPTVEYLKSTVNKDIHPPLYYELTTAIQHELFKDFSVKLQYIYKKGWDFYGWALYDKATGKFWYKYENAPDWWVPFTTIVPAYGAFPEKQVTMYFISLNSPWNNQFTLQMNIPEMKRNYHGLELIFDKRYSNGWSLGGSIVLSRHRFFNTGGNPNQFTNGYGKDGTDRPITLKSYGTLNLPLGFVGSFFYIFDSGSPWGRSVTVVPPAAWATANKVQPWSYGVMLEETGTRRGPYYNKLDLRLEKELRLPYGKLGLFIDVYNALGNTYVTVGQNPGGTWYPDGPNLKTGRFVPAYDYGRVTGIDAVRTYKFSFRFTF